VVVEALLAETAEEAAVAAKAPLKPKGAVKAREG
jgi:hypothetical protein